MEISELENNIDNFITELRDSELSQATLKSYRNNIDKFIEYLKVNKISTLTKSQYIDYREFMQIKYKISTLNRYVVVLNKYLSFLGHDELKIKQVKQQRKHYLENVPTVTDYKRIIRAAKKNDLMIYYVLLIISNAGLRVSATCMLTVEALKEAKKNDDYIKIFSKGKYNEIPFPAWLRRDLLKYARENKIESGYLFPSPKVQGKPISRKTIWERIHKVTGQARVNLDKGHPHAFRHLFGKCITPYVNNDNLLVADILGHESTKTTEQYQQRSKKEISKILNDFRLK